MRPIPNLCRGTLSGVLLGCALTLSVGCGNKDGGDTSGGADGADGADGGEGGDGGGGGDGGDDGADGADGADGGAPDPSPVVAEAQYQCSVSGSADDAIIFTATVEDPQGIDTLDRLAGHVNCLDSGGRDLMAATPLSLACGTDGMCVASFSVNTIYPMDCTTAPDHECTATVYDEDGNVGTGLVTWIGR